VVWPVAGYIEYHTDGDRLSVVDPADLEAVAQASAELIGRLAVLPVGPLLGAPVAPAPAPSAPAGRCRR
jgi:hypothetical protein